MLIMKKHIFLCIVICFGLVPDYEIPPLEDYIKSANKLDALNEFPSSSETKLYLEGNLLINSNQSDSARFKKISEKLKTNSPELYERLFYRKLVRDLESNDSELRKKSMITLK